MFDSKSGQLIIDQNAWAEGIASSPYAGLADLRNIDPHTKPGALLCGRASLLESGAGLFDSFPRHAVFDEENDILYVATEDGKLYRRSNGGIWSEYVKVPTVANWSPANNCNGLLIWKGYILLADTTKLHAIDIGSFTYDDWQTFEEGTRDAVALPHTMFVDDEDVVYITDGRWIASLQEVNGQVFDANDPATYTWNPTALDLPEGYVATTLSFNGKFLVIGSRFGAPTNRGNRAYLFPWDRVSASFTLPMRAKGNGVWQSITQNNEVYSIVDRKTAKLYSSNLTAYDVLKELRSLSGETRCYPDAIEVVDDEVLSGIGSTSTGVTGCGVYGFKNGLTRLANTVSGGETRIEIGSVTGIGEDKYVITWTDGTTHGADIVDSFRATGYKARLDTSLFIVGTPNNLRQFTNLDIYLGRDLAEGQGIKVSYRESLDDDWVLAKEFTFATHGAVSRLSNSTNMTELMTVQLRIEMTTATNSATSPELLAVSLS